MLNILIGAVEYTQPILWLTAITVENRNASTVTKEGKDKRQTKTVIIIVERYSRCDLDTHFFTQRHCPNLSRCQIHGNNSYTNTISTNTGINIRQSSFSRWVVGNIAQSCP
jgi:hypothetical protein